MATVWAKSSGNWTDTTLWAFWNEATQQIEDYGQTPQNGDTIYMNGYTVSYPTSSTWADNLSMKDSLISNGENPFTNNSGGSLNYRWHSGASTITCNFECFQGKLLGIKNQNQPTTLNIIGNIYVDAGTFTGASTCRFFNFTGNILMKSGVLVGSSNSSGPTMTITGNALPTESSNATLFYTNTLSLTVNGVVGIAQNLATATVNGKIEMGLNRLLTGTTLNINGVINYRSNNNTNGIRFTNLNILNPDTFTWKDISEPRSNPFIIVTDADMNNRQQYPAPANVKKDIPYAWGELIGLYLPDYPPETVVLKDYVYDGGEMVGTLDLPQVPTTSDIVTAIKNDSDLGGKIDTTNTNVGNISTAVTTIDGKVDIIDTNVDTLLSRLTSVLTQRLGQSVTVEILQQILVAHLNN